MWNALIAHVSPILLIYCWCPCLRCDRCYCCCHFHQGPRSTPHTHIASLRNKSIRNLNVIKNVECIDSSRFSNPLLLGPVFFFQNSRRLTSRVIASDSAGDWQAENRLWLGGWLKQCNKSIKNLKVIKKVQCIRSSRFCNPLFLGLMSLLEAKKRYADYSSPVTQVLRKIVPNFDSEPKLEKEMWYWIWSHLCAYLFT